MPRKPLLTAALATGMAVSTADAHQITDVAGDDIVHTEPDFDSHYDVLTFDLDTGFAGLDLRPEIIETTGSDEWDAGINYANTSGADWCFNDTIIHGTVPKDSVSGGGKDRKGRMLDNVIRRDGEITPETGLTGPGNVRARKPRVGDGARRLRKQRTRN